MDQDGTCHGGRPWSSPYCARWGHSSPLQRMRHCVRCGPSYPQKKGHTHPHPIFGSCLLWPNGWMDEDAAWYGVDRGPGHIVLDGVPAPAKWHISPPPIFGSCLLWPRSPVSATAELLSYLCASLHWSLRGNRPDVKAPAQLVAQQRGEQ